MQHLKWATIQERGGRKIPWYDVINIEQIIRPVYLQPDPAEENHSFYNHFVKRNSAC